MSELGGETDMIPQTEQRNLRTMNMDSLPADRLVRLLFEETIDVRQAVEAVLPQLSALVEVAARCVMNGGRIIYVGAGTSGRLAVLDASECPPTFSVPATMVVGVIAGGNTALTTAVEGAEDDIARGAAEVKELNVNEDDVVIGLASSGSTPFVAGALQQARMLRAVTAVIVNVTDASLAQHADFCLAAITGPEPLTGSTRMRAGTAQKVILNVISTAVMVRTGRVYGNLMVDVLPTNRKLRNRAVRIVAEAAGVSMDIAASTLEHCNWHCKTAILMLAASVTAEEAIQMLGINHGNVRTSLEAWGAQFGNTV
jgi:N-acetylmuramic acid 6-phosphate etherase